MNKQTKILLLSLFAAVFFTGLLYAEESDREGAFGGVFLTRAEYRIGDQVYLALVVKPFEHDDHVTIIVPRNDDFMHAARELREGDKVEIGFVREEGQKWLKRIKIERRTEEPGPPEDAHRRELGIHRRELQEQAGNLKRELKGLRNDQDEEAREIQARLREINQQLKNIERELKGPEQRERRIEAEEIRVILDREGEKREMAELKEAAARAKREGRHDKADQLRRKAEMLSDQLAAHSGEIKKIHAQNLKQQIVHLREMAREAKQRGEMERSESLWAQAEELQRVLKREFEQPKMKKPVPEGPPEMPPPPLYKAPPIEEQFDILRAQLKEAFANQLQKIREQLKEVVGPRLEQITGGFKDMAARVERLENELNELRAENEQLRRALRERVRSPRESDRQVRERISPEAQRRPGPEERERRLERQPDERRRGDRPEREGVERRDREPVERERIGRRDREPAEREERRLQRDRDNPRENAERGDNDGGDDRE